MEFCASILINEISVLKSNKGNEIKNTAFAGVGRPLNVFACVESLLNIASLTAEKIGSKAAMMILKNSLGKIK